MQANTKPATPGDGAPGSEYPALINMSNQHTKLSQARSEEPAPTKLNDQHNTQAMPVRAHNGCAEPKGCSHCNSVDCSAEKFMRGDKSTNRVG
eukprot:scaffold108008_cov54-Phaeocystis_antarctica.AAC.2